MFLFPDPVAPGNLRIVSSTSSSLTLTWDTPSPLNGPLGVYQLRYTIDQSDESAATILFVDTFTIDSIQADTTYHFSVRAATMGQTGEALWGPYSNDIWVRNGMCYTCSCVVYFYHKAPSYCYFNDRDNLVIYYAVPFL